MTSSSSASPPTTGISSVHQSITRSDFEKKRWPPISIRLPLWRIVQEIPPMRSPASSTIGRIEDRRQSSNAAVNPAGPAPMITAVLWGTAMTATRLPWIDRAIEISGTNDYLVDASDSRVVQRREDLQLYRPQRYVSFR